MGKLLSAAMSNALSVNRQPFMFQMLSSTVHAQRKRMMAQVYSKTFVQSSQDLTEILNTGFLERLCPHLRALCGKQVDIHRENQAIALDVTSVYLFGLGISSNFVQDVESRDYFIQSFTESLNGIFWLNEFPRLTRVLRRFGIPLVSSNVYEAQKAIEKYCFEMCQKTKASLEPSEKGGSTTSARAGILYSHLRPKLEQHYPSSEDVDSLMAAEMLDHLIAGNDGAGNTLTFLFFELSRNPKVQQQVRAELEGIREDSPYDLENLALLDAVLVETMRLHPAGLGPHLRIVPSKGAKLGPLQNVPPGTTVGATAWAMHRHPEFFPDGDKWEPARWLNKSEEEKREMYKWFFAFGAGGRKCIGNYFGIRGMLSIPFFSSAILFIENGNVYVFGILMISP